MKLDDAYANATYIEGADLYPARWADAARTFRKALGARAKTDLSYGHGKRHVYDLFQPNGPARGVVVFVHGGYWLRFDKSSWSHLASGALARGWAAAMPSYDLCPDQRISRISEQVARMITHLAARVDGPIALTGHSAGGHLVARMLAPGMLPPEVAARVHHVAPISPVADLRPLLQTSMNADLGLIDEEAAAESPVLQPSPDTSVTVWVGADERPAFLAQAKALADAWDVDRNVLLGKHHFDVIDALGDAHSNLVAALTTVD